MRPIVAGLIVSWSVTGVSLAFLAKSWSGAGEAGRESAAVEAADGGEEARLRLALAVARSESEALRDELDRLLDLYRGTLPAEKTPADGGRAAGVGESSDAADDPAKMEERERLAELALQYGDALSRAAYGDEGARDEAYDAVMTLVRAGPAAFPALREAYLATTDPQARVMMTRAFLSTFGPEAKDFVAKQLAMETDPDVAEALAVRASQMASPTTDPVFRDAFLGVLSGDSYSTAEAKVAAIRGLRHHRRDDRVERTLLAAVNDPSPDVRMAAYYELASRPGLRDRVESIVAAETDPDARAVGECRILLGDLPFTR